jgi:sensor histidine kinase YesM
MNYAAPPELHHRRMNHPEPPEMHRLTAPFAPPPGPSFYKFNNSTMIKNFTFFFCMAFALLMYNTFRLLGRDKNRAKQFNSKLWILIPENVLLCFLFIMSYALVDDRPSGALFNGLHLLKCVIVTVISYLFVHNLLLANHRQQIVIENEKLKTQNIQVQYEALAGQVNPHFLFNSLNTLSSLVREHQEANALKYINRLSDIFRYVLYENNQSIKTLREELEMIDSYRYLLKIRYENSLCFNVRIDEKYKSYLLPNLSLQPLLENTVKHNEASEDKPLVIDIYTDDNDQIIVRNRIQQKWIENKLPGIGLKNLNNRYQLLFAKDVTVENDGVHFTVKLPLINSNSGL